MHICMFNHACRWLEKPEEVTQFPWDKITGGFELSNVNAGSRAAPSARVASASWAISPGLIKILWKIIQYPRLQKVLVGFEYTLARNHTLIFSWVVCCSSVMWTVTVCDSSQLLITKLNSSLQCTLASVSWIVCVSFVSEHETCQHIDIKWTLCHLILPNSELI